MVFIVIGIIIVVIASVVLDILPSILIYMDTMNKNKDSGKKEK